MIREENIIKKTNKESEHINKIYLYKTEIHEMIDGKRNINNASEKREGICIEFKNGDTTYRVFIYLDLIAKYTYDDILAKIIKFYQNPQKVPELPLIISSNINESTITNTTSSFNYGRNKYENKYLVFNYDENLENSNDKLTFPSLLEAMKYAKWREKKKNKHKPVYYVVSASGEYYCSTTTQINGKQVYLQINDLNTARKNLKLCYNTEFRQGPTYIDFNEDERMYSKKPDTVIENIGEYRMEAYYTSPLATVLHAQMLKRRTRKRK